MSNISLSCSSCTTNQDNSCCVVAKGGCVHSFLKEEQASLVLLYLVKPK